MGAFSFTVKLKSKHTNINFLAISEFNQNEILVCYYTY